MPPHRAPCPEAAASGGHGARPRLRTWRRALTALGNAAERLRTGGQATAVLGEAPPGLPSPREVTGAERPALGPHAQRFIVDTGPWRASARPRQGHLGDCWVMAAMLGIHATAPERLHSLMTREQDGTVTVRLPGARQAVTVDRAMPVDASGAFVYARQDDGAPGWVGVLEKAVALQVAGGYRSLQRGLGRFGLEMLLGEHVRTLLLTPSASRIDAWRRENRVVLASTHPLSGLVGTMHGPLPPNHVFAVVGADARSGHVLLRNPVRPRHVLRLDARSFRRGFLSVDVTAPLR